MAGLGLLTAKSQTAEAGISELADSMCVLLGSTEGGYTRNMISRLPESDRNRCREDYLKAMREVFSGDAYYADGLKRALDLYGFVRELESKGVKVDRNLVIEAFESGLDNTSLTREQIAANVKATNGLYDRLQAAVREHQAAVRKAQAAENEAAGKAFVDSLKKKNKSIKTTESGLSYRMVKKGSGKVTPQAGDKVKVHYTGRHIDGSVFDSSVERGEPAVFGVGQVIKGFGEGLQMMTPGSKYTFYIPASIGYGETGGGDRIKPGETLQFDVELLEINPKDE